MWLTVFSLMVEHTSRRKTLEIAGSVATVTFLAGCSSDSEPSDGDDGSTDDGSTDDGSTDDGSTDDGSTDDGSTDDGSTDDGSTDDGSTDDGSTDDGSTDDGSTDDGSSGDDSNTVDPAEWEDVSTIHLESDGVNWKGVAPEMIADAQNPTIVLFEGNEYEFIYENGDGGRHNLELWNEEQSVVNGYSTELMREQGEQLSFTAEATPEIANYVCNPHSATMIGEVRIE